MADFLPQHSVRVAPPASYPVACDGCGAAGQITDGRLPEGWRIVDLPTCEWRHGAYYECGRCAREMDARFGGSAVAS